MDSLTHLALGACIGELCVGQSLGKKALLIGAAAQSLPDIDFVASFWLSPANDLLAHRGFTHSFLFVFLAVYPLSLIAMRWRWLANMPIKSWTLFFFLELVVHLVLDAFNAYGTAWFEPISHYRVSFHTLFVADPFFSVWLGIAVFLLVLLPRVHNRRKVWAWMGIAVSSFYLCYGLLNKGIVENTMKESLQAQQISYQRYFTTPTPGNIWLWYIVVEDSSGFYLGYQSVLDKEAAIPFQFYKKTEESLDSIDDHKNLQRLIRFSEGYYVVTQYEGRLVFNDLRFGQMLGWDDPLAPFVFYYYLDHPEDNKLLIQRGRFARWNLESVISFADRIKGI